MPATGTPSRSKSSAATGSRSSSRPTRRSARTPVPGGRAESMRRCARRSEHPKAASCTSNEQEHRAGLRADQTQPRDHPIPTTRQGRRQVGMAPHRSDPQPPQAPQPLDRTRHGVNRQARGSPGPGSAEPPHQSQLCPTSSSETSHERERRRRRDGGRLASGAAARPCSITLVGAAGTSWKQKRRTSRDPAIASAAIAKARFNGVTVTA